MSLSRDATSLPLFSHRRRRLASSQGPCAAFLPISQQIPSWLDVLVWHSARDQVTSLEARWAVLQLRSLLPVPGTLSSGFHPVLALWL